MSRYRSFALLLSLLLLSVGCARMQGDIALKTENYSEAIAHFEKHLQKSPEDSKILARRGFAYLKTGQLDASIADFEKALSLTPNDPYATLYLGLAYLNKGNEEKAIAIWDTYENEDAPLVAEEVLRQKTLLEIVHSHRLAQKALKEETKLNLAAIKPNSMAVVYFDDRSSSKEFGPYQKAIAAMVTTDLAQIQALNMVERVRIQALFKEMKLGQTGIVDADTAPRVAKLLGAESVLVGSMTKGSIRVTANISPVDGSAPSTFSVTSPVDKFYELQKEIVYNVVKAKDVPLTEAEKTVIASYHTKSLKAFTYYGKALEAQDAGHWKQAKNLFTAAVKADPGFGAARSARDATPADDAPAISEVMSLPLEAMMKKVTSLVGKGINEAAEAQREADSPTGNDNGEGAAGEAGGDTGDGGGGHP